MAPMFLLLAGAAIAYALKRRSHAGPPMRASAASAELSDAPGSTPGGMMDRISVPLKATTREAKVGAVLATALVTAAVFSRLPRIPQFEKYHDFADKRRLAGIPYFTNVVSNAAFVVAGARGLYFVLKQAPVGDHGVFMEPHERWPFAGMFLGSLLVGLGSGYYHLAPDNPKLAWDRWPMTITFVSFLNTVINDRISPQAARGLYVPLLLLGLASVSHWRATERAGHSDIRAYGFVHVGSSILVPLILLLFPSRYRNAHEQWKVLGLYALAMTGEVLDKPVYAMGHLISGHSLKHLFGAAAVESEHQMLRRRIAAAAPTGD